MKKNTMNTPDRTTQPPLKQIDSLSIGQPKTIVHSNGLTQHTFDSNNHDAIRLDLIFKAGTAMQSKLLAASTTNRMLKEGTTKHSGHHIASRMDYHGAYIDLTTTKDYCWASLFALKKSIPRLLPLLAEMIKEPAFKPADFRILNSQQKQDFVVNSQKPKHMARQLFNEMIFGAETPYGQSATVSDFDKLSRSDLAEFHSRFYNHRNATLILAGAIDESVQKAVNDHFSDEWGSAGIAQTVMQQSVQATGEHWTEKPGSLQSAIQMGKLAMKRNHPDFAGFIMLNTVLGGYFGSRLMSNIREDKGYTYGIYSQIAPFEHDAYFTIATEVGREVTRAALDEIHYEINKLRTEAIPYDELQLVRNYLTGSYLRGLDGPYNQSEKFRSILGIPQGMDYFTQTLQTIQTVTADELLVLAKRYLDPESMLTIVVGEKIS